jgi:uncharacterized protein
LQLPEKPFLIAAGGSVRTIAQWAQHLGGEIIAIDHFGDSDTQAAAFWLEAPKSWKNLPKLLRQLPDAPFLFCGGLDSHAEVVEEIRQTREVLGINPKALRFLSDWGGGTCELSERNSHSRLNSSADEFSPPEPLSPRLLSHLASEFGIAVPESRVAEDPPATGSWLWKQRRSCGGLGVKTKTAAAELSPHQRLHMGYWQCQVPGRAIGLSFMGGGSGTTATFLGGCGMLRTPNRIRSVSLSYSGSFGPLPFTRELIDPVVRLANELTSRLDLRGWFGLDMMLDSQGKWWLLEVNPRWCASMEILVNSTAEGATLLQSHLAACRGTATPPRTLLAPSGKHTPRFSIKKIVYATHSFTVPALDWHALTGDNQVQLRDLPSTGSPVPAHAPILSLIAQGTDPAAATRLLRSALKRLRAILPC